MESAGFRITSDPDETRLHQPDQSDPREFQSLPLRILVAADLAPQQKAGANWEAGSHLRRIDANSFAETMRALAPSLHLEIPNRLSESPKKLSLTLSFDTLDAFHPNHIVAQIPPLHQLAQIRGALTDVVEKKIDLTTFKSRLIEQGVDSDWAEQLHQSLQKPDPPKSSPTSTQSSPSSSENDTLDRLLGMVETGDDTPAAPPAPSAGDTFLNNLFAAVGEEAPKERVEKSVAEMMRDDFDALIQAQLIEVIDHPAFRRLESAWRGLKFLVSNINFRRGILLDALPVDVDQLSEALYHQAILPGHKSLSGESDEPPFSVILLDFAFSERDLDLVKDLAGTGASLLAPVVAAASPTLFGVASPKEMDQISVLWQHFEKPAYIQWSAFRREEEAKSIALVAPPFVLRPAYDADHPADGLAFEESDCLWGNGSWAAGVAIGLSHAGIQWPSQIAGQQSALTRMPLWGKGQALSATLSESKERELGDAGFVVLRQIPGRDAVFVARASTLHQPASFQDSEQNFQARAQALLDCQLFATRSAVFLNQCLLNVSPGASTEDIRSTLIAQFRQFLGSSGAAVGEEHVQCEAVNVNDQEMLALRLQPPAPILGYPVTLTMPIPLGG